jgi:leader peptidase (prepilin peptidase)/N-methyltransferase
MIEVSEFWGNVFTVLFGLIVGSFLNVVVARVPKKKDLVWKRSACPSCQAPIHWYDNVPVLSYLALRGKCRACQKRISLRYPVIEILTAFLFLAAKVRFGMTPLLVLRDWPFLGILVAVTFIDLEHRIIPDVLSLPGVLLGLLTAYWVPGLGLIQGLLGAALGFGFFYGVALLYQWRTGKSGLGGGDVKLLAMMGAFIGPHGVFTTILVSSIFGSVAGIAWGKVQGKGKLLKTSIPFGPFLVVGCLYYYLLGDLVWLPFTEPM